MQQNSSRIPKESDSEDEKMPQMNYSTIIDKIFDEGRQRTKRSLGKVKDIIRAKHADLSLSNFNNFYMLAKEQEKNNLEDL